MEFHAVRQIANPLAFIFLLTSSLAAQTMKQIEVANALGNDFDTPHTKWAKPYAAGKLRVLYLAHQNPNINALPLRHCVELERRFDIAPKAVLVMTSKGNTYAITYRGGSGVYGGKLGEQRLARLLKQKFDCFIVTGPIMGHLPKQSREKILASVRNGAGMLFTYGDNKKDKPLIAQFKLQTEKVSLLADMQTRRYTLGKGRVVVIDKLPAKTQWNVYAPTSTQRLFGFNIPRDLFYECQGRALLWAARREPQFPITLSAKFKSNDRQALKGTVIGIRGETTNPKVFSEKIITRIRSPRFGTKVIKIDKGKSSKIWSTAKLPDLPAGDYWIDAIAETRKGVVGWATVPLTVASKHRVTKVNLVREFGEAGDFITGTVVLNEPLVANHHLQVRAIDRYGRILSLQRFKKQQKQFTFSLATYTQFPGFLGIEAAIVDKVSDVHRILYPGAYTITKRKHGQWNYMIWGRLYASQFLEHADDFFAANGFTCRMETSQVPWWYMTRAGMNYTPYCSSGLYRLPDMGPQEPMVDEKGILSRCDGCWNDEPAVSKRLAKYLHAERDYRGHGVLAYSMGDEVAVFGSCLHPQCWKVYQDWLKGQYGTIERLNKSWNSKFTSFAKIRPIVDETSIAWYPKRSQRIPWQLGWANNEHSSLRPTSGSTAWKKSWINYPRYIDRRSFQYWNFGQYCRRFRNAARVIDPHARCGVEGSLVHLDVDIDAVVRNTGWWMPYGGENGAVTNEVVRSIAPKDYLYGNFAAGFSFWPSVLRGGNTLGNWRVDNALTPSMQLRADLKWMAKSGRIVFDGLGTLLNGNPRSKMLDDGIVLLHSMPSIEMAKIGDGPLYGIFRTRDSNGRSIASGEQKFLINRRSHRAWHRNIRASGMQFRYTTDGKIRRGEFTTQDCKVIVLPQYEVISTAEEQMLRRFVAEGGTLIADVRPGIYGERGKQRKGGVLDDLFGVKHLASAKPKECVATVHGTFHGAQLRLQKTKVFVNPSVQVTTGKALGKADKTPICICNSVGKGRAILLNFTMWSFPKLAVHNSPDDAVELFRTLMTLGGAKRPASFVDTNGRQHRNIELMRWQTGRGTEVWALHGPALGTWPEPNGNPLKHKPAPFEDLKTEVPVTLKLQQPRYVYEMRTGRRLNLTKTFSTTAKMFDTTLLTVSDRPLEKASLTPVTRIVRRGSMLKIRVVIPRAQGSRVLKFTALSPSGKSAPWFTRSLIVRDGHGTLELPIGFNEELGGWTITATDLMTNFVSTTEFKVR